MLYPYYTSYFGWEDKQKIEKLSSCETAKDVKLCKCIDEAIFKEYTYDEYKLLDKNSSEYQEFLKDSKEECQDEGWF